VNIVVLVKQVPDSGTELKLDPADVRDAHSGDVTVLTVSPD
jgi:hypothetical protein